jgi:peptidoglycan/xylan/chitin deacetylase (PgdA/CDA1 family)
VKDLSRGALGFARRPIHPAWVIVITTAFCAALLTAIGIHIAELVSSNHPPSFQAAGASAVPTAISAAVVTEEDRRLVRFEGDPGSRFLMLENDRVLGIVTIGDDGLAESTLPESVADGSTVRCVLLSDRSLELALPLRPSPAATATATAVPHHEASPTPAVRKAERPPQAPALSPPVLQLIADAGPQIALTFDGNASSNRTGELLDLLHELDLEVTLFVTGRFIDRYPEVIRRAVLSGHDIGNHTFSHPHLTTYERNRRHDLRTVMTRARFRNELQKTERAFRKATGRAMAPLWRAPYGEENRTLRGWALELGYLHIRWSSLEGASLDSRDWVADEHSSMYQNSSAMMDRLLRFPELRGGIVLMHMATHRDEAPWKELPTFVETLRDRGVEPTKVIRMLESSPAWKPWLQRARANRGWASER